MMRSANSAIMLGVSDRQEPCSRQARVRKLPEVRQYLPFIHLVIFCVFAVGCASSPVRMYSGPPLPAERVAVIQTPPYAPASFSGKPVEWYELRTVDGVDPWGTWNSIFSFRRRPHIIFVAPGRHNIDVVFHRFIPGGGFPSIEQTWSGHVSVETAANHTYTVSMDGKEGVWTVSTEITVDTSGDAK